MLEYAEPVAKLIDEFKRMPGVGGKSAQRLAFYILRAPPADIERLVTVIQEVKARIGYCSACNSLTETDPCRICASPARDRSIICVVEEPSNLVTIEKTRSYRGLYHVLHGCLSPLRGIGPDDLYLNNLIPRLKPANNQGVEVKEIILATNPNTEGEATAVYVSRLLKPLGVKVTRIALGMPVGSDLEFADEVTMEKSLLNRHEM